MTNTHLLKAAQGFPDPSECDDRNAILDRAVKEKSSVAELATFIKDHKVAKATKQSPEPSPSADEAPVVEARGYGLGLTIDQVVDILNYHLQTKLSIEARRLLAEYIESRPPSESGAIFIGERGPLSYYGLRGICEKYAAINAHRFYQRWPTRTNLSFTTRPVYRDQTHNDLVGLAQILGHESLNTTSIYSRRSQDELQASINDLRYE